MKKIRVAQIVITSFIILFLITTYISSENYRNYQKGERFTFEDGKILYDICKGEDIKNIENIYN